MKRVILSLMVLLLSIQSFAQESDQAFVDSDVQALTREKVEKMKLEVQFIKSLRDQISAKKIELQNMNAKHDEHDPLMVIGSLSAPVGMIYGSFLVPNIIESSTIRHGQPLQLKKGIAAHKGDLLVTVISGVTFVWALSQRLKDHYEIKIPQQDLSKLEINLEKAERNLELDLKFMEAVSGKKIILENK